MLKVTNITSNRLKVPPTPLSFSLSPRPRANKSRSRVFRSPILPGRAKQWPSPAMRLETRPQEEKDTRHEAASAAGVAVIQEDFALDVHQLDNGTSDAWSAKRFTGL